MAGAKAGAIVGVIFTLTFLALDFTLILNSLPETKQALSEVHEQLFGITVIYILIGLLIALLISGVIGAIAGMFFAILVIRFPIRSVYAKAVPFGLCLCLLASLVARWSIAQDIPALALSAIDSIIFAILFNRWAS